MGRGGWHSPPSPLPCLCVTHMWENLKRASKLMLRSKTFMVPGWGGPTAAPQGCKLPGEGGVRKDLEPTQSSQTSPRSRVRAQELQELLWLRSLPRPAGASAAGCCRARGPWGVAGLLQGQGSPRGSCSGAAPRPGELLENARCRGSAAGSWKRLCAR